MSPPAAIPLGATVALAEACVMILILLYLPYEIHARHFPRGYAHHEGSLSYFFFGNHPWVSNLRLEKTPCI